MNSVFSLSYHFKVCVSGSTGNGRSPGLRAPRPWPPLGGRSPGEGNGNPVLPGKSHEQRRLVGYSPRGQKESDMSERLKNRRTRGPRLRRFTSWTGLTGTGKSQTLKTVKCQLLVKSYLFDSKMPFACKMHSCFDD